MKKTSKEATQIKEFHARLYSVGKGKISQYVDQYTKKLTMFVQVKLTSVTKTKQTINKNKRYKKAC